jgi:uncharacterized protein DUF397
VGDLSRPDQESSRGTMDVTGIAWRTSSYSGSNGGACIEVGTTGLVVAIRDSKCPNGPQLAFAPATWNAFTNQLKAVAPA